MFTVDDTAKSREQLLTEMQALRAQLASLTGGDALHHIGNQHTQLCPCTDAYGALDLADVRETFRASQKHSRDIERRRQAADGLRQILAIVNSRRSVDEILQQIIALATRMLSADAGAIYRLHESEKLLRIRAAHGLAAEAADVNIPAGWGPIGLAVAQRRPIAATLESVDIPGASIHSVDLRQAAGWAALTRRYATVLAVPLIIRDEVYGAAALYLHVAHTFSEEELELALAFSDHAVIVIENARLFAVAHDTAALEERQRLARELHDSVTQTLYVVKLYAEAAARRVAAGDVATATTHLREVRGAAQEALQEMRLLIFELHPPVLEQEGLAPAIQARLDAVEGRAGLETAFSVEGDHRPAAEVAQALYRVAQEALNNALKHAQARRICVVLQQALHSTRLTLSDDGIGFDPEVGAAAGGLGLRGMRERVAQLGGRLTLKSAPGSGTVVCVEVGS